MTNYNKDTDYLMDESISKKYIYLYNSANRYLNVLHKHRRKDSSIKAYASSLRMIIKAIGDLKGNISVGSLTEDDLYDLIGCLNRKESTNRGKMNVLGRWIQFETGKNPVSSLDILWNKESTKRTFIDMETYRILAGYARSEMELMVMMLGSMMGLRMMEIANLKLNDIKDGKLTVYGKGHGEGKVVIMDMPAIIEQSIKDYIREERALMIDRYGDNSQGHLLVQTDLNIEPGSNISNNTIIHFYARLSKDSGIHVTSHCMRRLYCCTLANECGLRNDLDTLRRMMRHEKLDTTITCYLSADENRMKIASNKLETVFTNI